MNRLFEICLLAVASTLAACSRSGQPQQSGAPPAVAVTVSHPRTAVVTNWDEYPGHLEAVDMVEIKAQVGGYLESIHFVDGAEVKAGDLLFVIDRRTYQASFDQAQADVKRAETRLEQAENELKRAEALRDSKAISVEELDVRAAAVRDAKAALTWSKAGEATARLNLDFTRITAPVSGKVGRRLVSVGSLVEKGGPQSTVLATIVSLDPIYCYFDADERSFLRYRNHGGMPGSASGASPSVPCELGLAGEEGFTYRGRLDFFNNQVDQNSGTIRVRAVLENANRALVPGLFARVRVPAGPPGETLLVPDAAIGSDQGRKFVYVVNGESIVEMRPIQTGRPHGAERVVLSGLKETEIIVVNGLTMLRPGVKVQAQNQSAAVSTSGTASTH